MLAQISEVSLIPASPSQTCDLRPGNSLQLSYLYWKQLSGANITLLEDRQEVSGKIIQISGTPEQAEKAQSLLQGFILSSNSPFACPFTPHRNTKLMMIPPFLSFGYHLTGFFFSFDQFQKMGSRVVEQGYELDEAG